MAIPSDISRSPDVASARDDSSSGSFGLDGGAVTCSRIDSSEASWAEWNPSGAGRSSGDADPVTTSAIVLAPPPKAPTGGRATRSMLPGSFCTLPTTGEIRLASSGVALTRTRPAGGSSDPRSGMSDGSARSCADRCPAIASSRSASHANSFPVIGGSSMRGASVGCAPDNETRGDSSPCILGTGSSPPVHDSASPSSSESTSATSAAVADSPATRSRIGTRSGSSSSGRRIPAFVDSKPWRDCAGSASSPSSGIKVSVRPSSAGTRCTITGVDD